MEVGDLVIRKVNGEVGIVVSKVRINSSIYLWVYVASEGRAQIFPSELLQVLDGSR